MEQEKQAYFKLSTNEYGKHWLFYRPLKSEPGRYGCWMPIDDEFYEQFKKLSQPEPEESQKELWKECEDYFARQSILRRGIKEIFADMAAEFTIQRKK